MTRTLTVDQYKHRLDIAQDALAVLTVGTCTCGTKTHVMEMHAPTCRYRIAEEALRRIKG